MKKRTRAALAPLVVAVAIAAAVIVYFVLIGQSTNVEMPANDAAPEEVVRVYLEALGAHDCDTALALTTPTKGASWCTSVARITDAQVRKHVVEEPAWSGHAAPDAVVNVPVTFDIRWRMFNGDISMPAGPMTWGYLLVRSSPTEPWRIFAEGNG